MKNGTPTRDGDFGWVFGVNSFQEPHLLRPGEASMCINCVRDEETAGWKHRPGYIHNQLTWPSLDHKQLWENSVLQAYDFQHKSDVIYALAGGRVFRFVRSGPRTLAGECLTPEQRSSKKNGWVTGVPGGAIINDGKNPPQHCIGRVVVQIGSRREDIRSGRAGAYIHGRFFYVSADGKSILASDIDNPVSMQEAVESNVYGWDSPDRTDTIIALAKHRVAANDIELGNLIFSTDSDIYTINVRGDRVSWGTELGRVSVAIPDVSFAGGRAATTLNANLVFMARQKHVNLSMLNQLASQFERADAFSGQFLEANEWFTQPLIEYSIVASHGADLLVSASPRVAKDGQIYHRFLLSFRAIKGTDEGLSFQGAWAGPRVLDIVSSQRNGFLIAGLTEEGFPAFWTLADNANDLDSHGLSRPIVSCVVSRAYTHKEIFMPKTRGSQELYIHKPCGPVHISLMHRTVSRGSWQAFREKSFTLSLPGTVGPISFGDSYAANDTPGANANDFYSEQVAVSWYGEAVLAAIASNATSSENFAQVGDFGADPLEDETIDPFATCEPKRTFIPFRYL